MFGNVHWIAKRAIHDADISRPFGDGPDEARGVPLEAIGTKGTHQSNDAEASAETLLRVGPTL
jgi:hypothetical protein